MAREVVDAAAFDPAGSGALLVAAAEPGLPGNALHLYGADGGRRLLAAAGSHNERAAFSPDGRSVAFVSDRTGLPAVYTLALEPAGASPVQLTNRGLRRVPGRRPEGYLPPPRSGPLRWSLRGIGYDFGSGSVHIDPASGSFRIDPVAPAASAGVRP
jgi:hypothetical protein